MKRRRLTQSRVVRVVGAFVVMIFLSALVLFLFPGVDDTIGFVNGINLRWLQGYALSDGSLSERVNRQYTVASWRAFHPYSMFHTRVDCYAKDRAGAKVVLSWEIGRLESPYGNMPRAWLYIQPVTRAAYLLAPCIGLQGIDPKYFPIEPVVSASYFFSLKNEGTVSRDGGCNPGVPTYNLRSRIFPSHPRAAPDHPAFARKTLATPAP